MQGSLFDTVEPAPAEEVTVEVAELQSREDTVGFLRGLIREGLAGISMQCEGNEAMTARPLSIAFSYMPEGSDG